MRFHTSHGRQKKRRRTSPTGDAGSGDQMLFAGCAARHLSPFSFSNYSVADESRDCLRIQICQPVEAGPSDWVGTEVWGTGGDVGSTQDGSHAGLIAVAESALARRPAALDQAQAASVGVAFVAGWMGLADYAGLQRGEAANSVWSNLPPSLTSSRHFSSRARLRRRWSNRWCLWSAASRLIRRSRLAPRHAS